MNSYGRLIVSERALVSKAKALDVMRKPFCVVCSHGTHITYICTVKKYIKVCPEGAPNNLQPAARGELNVTVDFLKYMPGNFSMWTFHL